MGEQSSMQSMSGVHKASQRRLNHRRCVSSQQASHIHTSRRTC